MSEYAQFKKMKKVRIGNQIWMSDNLDVVQFRNGELIAEAKNLKEWESGNESKKPMWCYYEFDSAYKDKSRDS